MSMFWEVPLFDVVDGREVCAICGQADCGDLRERDLPGPQHNLDEPNEETR